MDQQNVAAESPIVPEALHATPGLTDRLARGIHVADVGCAEGVSTVTMAAAFPQSRFLGVDADPANIERARQLCAARGLRNVYWLVAATHQLPARPTHELICAFDGLHGLPDRRGALHAIRAALADDGVYLWFTLDTDAGHARQLAIEAGFTRLDTLGAADAAHRVFALRG
jgi:ubiquinone/menaquinone biosynthesis C-methylase UbiE